jgi:hypothetical protein
MLTRPAQQVWAMERLNKDPSLEDYRSPDFEAIYIPSDVRWSAELHAIDRELEDCPVEAERIQRACISICSLVEAMKTMQRILSDEHADPTELAKALIRHLELGPTIPSFREIRFKLSHWMDVVQAALVKRDSLSIQKTLEYLPVALTGHAITAITKACTIFDEYCEFGRRSQSRWALCFDELEIAPEWLQRELLEALRSYEQRFIFKLTWSPVFPGHLMQKQERAHDYAPIRMWHTGVTDARPFCVEFSTRFLRDRLGNPQIHPRDVFGISPFSQDESDGHQSYKAGGQEWQAMVHLATIDDSFREYLSKRGIAADNPIVDDVALRDESLRKIKPIVLAREAFLKEGNGGVELRSRKVPPLYHGEDSVYAMSEGNPRLLAGLLNDMLDLRRRSKRRGGVMITKSAQARVLFAASLRMLTTIKTYPSAAESRRPPLSFLISRLGSFQGSELVGQEFKPDPVGSFFVDEDVRQELLEQIAAGLHIGALVSMGMQDEDFALSVMGSRIRLSYVLAPAFRLLFRNFRELRLSTALRIHSRWHQAFLFRRGGN